jgi:hypothetical protein
VSNESEVPWIKPRGMKPTTPIHPLARLRMNGAMISIPHAFKAGHTDEFYLHLQGKRYAEIAFF